MEVSNSNIGKEKENYALFMDSNLYHELLNTGIGSITKKQFDDLIKEKYNAVLAFDKKGKELNEIL